MVVADALVLLELLVVEPAAAATADPVVFNVLFEEVLVEEPLVELLDDDVDVVELELEVELLVPLQLPTDLMLV